MRLSVKNKMSLVLLALLSFSPAVFGANILGVFSITSVSHQIVYRRLMLELNKRGHNMTIVTPNPIRNPNLRNYREIDVSFFYETYDKEFAIDPKRLKRTQNFPELLLSSFLPISNLMCHEYLSSPQVQALIKENPSFDLLITEFGFNPCFYGFAKFSGYRHMGMYSFQTNPVTLSILGNPVDASYLPEVFLPYTGTLTFCQRLRILIFQAIMWIIAQYMITVQNPIARQYFGEDLPHVKDIGRNVSAMMVNTHFTIGTPRPYGPSLIEIGGPPFHIIGRKLKPLPKDIKAFLDDAPDGVIYFSLGTNVKTSNMSSKEETILIESFSKIKQKVLWKWENEDLKVNSKNIMKRKWFPQVDVLGHPNVKAFVTQAGLQSIGEAIEYHVPMIVMPFFADQMHNARKMELEGVALCFEYEDLNVEDFTRALNEIVYNEKYKKNVERLSALVKDQPIPPLEKAVWWTEYIIRHNGAPHLRSAATTMPWYQYYLIDVLAFIFASLFLFLFIIYITVRALLRLLFASRKAKIASRKAKKD